MTRYDWFHDWVTWTAAILLSLAAIWGLVWHKKSPIRRLIMFIWRRLIGEPFGASVRGYLTDVLQPELQQLNDKIDTVADTVAELTVLNSEQHAETAAKIEATADKIDVLQTELARHILANPGLPDHVGGPLPIIPTKHRQGY